MSYLIDIPNGVSTLQNVRLLVKSTSVVLKLTNDQQAENFKQFYYLSHKKNEHFKSTLTIKYY